MGRNFDDHGCDREGCDEYTKRAFMNNTPSEKAPHGYYISVQGTGGTVRDAHFLMFCSVGCLNAHVDEHGLGGNE